MDPETAQELDNGKLPGEWYRVPKTKADLVSIIMDFGEGGVISADAPEPERFGFAQTVSGKTVVFRLVLKDRETEFEIRRLDIGEKTGLETVSYPLFKDRQLLWGTVGRYDYLSVILVKSLERVEKLGLRRFACAARDILDIVYQEHIRAAELLSELDRFSRFDRDDELIHEILALDVDHVHRGVSLENSVGDRVHQVRLAEAAVTVDE